MKPSLFRLLLGLLWVFTSIHAQPRKTVQRPLKGSPNLQAVPLSAFITQNRAALKAQIPLTRLASPTTGQGMTALPIQMQEEPTKPASFQRAENGAIRWLKGQMDGLGKTQNTLAAAAVLLDEYKATLLLKAPHTELKLIHQETDVLGIAHLRYAQVFQGLPVWGRDLWIHLREDEFIINGTYEPTPRTIINAPRLTEADAIRYTIHDLQAKGRWKPPATRWPGAEPDAATPVWAATGSKKMERAYAVHIQANVIESFTYLVSAQDGRILYRTPHHCDLVGHKHKSPIVDAPSLADVSPDALPIAPVQNAATFVHATAKDLNGVARTFRALQHTDNKYYMVWDFPNLSSDFAFNPAALWSKGGSMILDAANTDALKFHTNTNTLNGWADASAVSAHYNANLVYQYYRSVHGRKALNDADKAMWSVVNVTEGGQQMDNAYWDGTAMYYGNGDTFFKPLAGGLDVAAHEITHGVVQHSANLVYQGQAGALNESFADVFAMMIDKDDYLIGEEVMRAGKGVALRDLANPANPNLFDPQPASMSQYDNTEEDNGGVHINSGIPNRAAYLVLKALGYEKIEKIYYRALTKYLTRNSQFIDARNALEQAAHDLYGDGTEVSTVKTAFDTVGIKGTSSHSTGAEDDVTIVKGGKAYITFMDQSGKIGLLDTATNEASLFNSASAVARVNQSEGDRSQLTTARNGERIWFINAQKQLAFLTIQTGVVEVFEQLKLKANAATNDLWNVAVSPDEACVAIVSAYENDPNLYFWCGGDVMPIALHPETTQAGVRDETILYPDVVAWSPNMNEPRVAFDAFHKTNLTTYWNTHEIDFEAGRIYDLLPGYGTDLSIGNVAYSKTNPDLVAYNVVGTDVQDVVLTNLDKQEDLLVDFPAWTINGKAINDASRPSFSPDDKFIVVTSEALKTVLFYERVADKVTQLSFSIPLYNAYWFVNGGNRVPSAAKITSPAHNANVSLDGNASTPLTFAWTASTDPDGDPLSYQWQISATADFSRTLFTSPNQSALNYKMTYADLNVLLKSISAGAKATLYHRVLSTDGTNTPVVSDAAKINFSRTLTSREAEAELPQLTRLQAPFPNPFRHQTTLYLDLAKAATVQVRVFDTLGRVVYTATPANLGAGKAQPLNIQATNWADGLYLYQVTTSDGYATQQFTGRLVFVK